MVVIKLLKLNNIEYKKTEKCAIFGSYDAMVAGVKKRKSTIYACWNR